VNYLILFVLYFKHVVMFFVIHVQHIVVLFHGLILKILYAYVITVMIIQNLVLLYQYQIHLHHHLKKTKHIVKKPKIVAMKLVAVVIQQALSHPVSISVIYVYLQLIFSISSSQEQVCKGSILLYVCSFIIIYFVLF
jgi:hypothetical protein